MACARGCCEIKATKAEASDKEGVDKGPDQIFHGHHVLQPEKGELNMLSFKTQELKVHTIKKVHL